MVVVIRESQRKDEHGGTPAILFVLFKGVQK